MQAWAEEEARMMAARGTNGHVRPAPVGYFIGAVRTDMCDRRLWAILLASVVMAGHVRAAVRWWAKPISTVNQ